MLSLFDNFDNYIKRILLKYKYLLFLIFVSVIALLLRYFLKDFRSGDYVLCLHPWFENIKHMGGINALQKQVGDYNILYQFIIALFTYFPVKELYLYKGVSILFDFILAISSGLLAINILNFSKNDKKKVFLITYACVLILPTVFLNSGLWAQCDSIYVSLIVLSLTFLVRNSYFNSFLMLGLAFSFKFQAIFVLPFFLFIWLVKKNVHIYHFLIMIIVFWLSGLPGYVFGRSMLAPFQVYINQTHTYNHIFLNYYNFAGLLGKQANSLNNYYLLSKPLILLTILILVIGYMYLITNSNFDSMSLLGTAIWTIYTCNVFLPSIHERYAYAVDILIVVLAVVNNKYIIVAIPELINSLLSYERYLFLDNSNVVLFSYLAIVIYAVYTIMIFKDCKNHFYVKEFNKMQI